MSPDDRLAGRIWSWTDKGQAIQRLPYPSYMMPRIPSRFQLGVDIGDSLRDPLEQSLRGSDALAP